MGPGKATNDWFLSYPNHLNHILDLKPLGPKTGGRPNGERPITERIWTSDSRIYTSTYSIITTKTYTPINLSVYIKIGTAVASFDHQIIHETNVFFDLLAPDVPDHQELWDSGGRATLAEAMLICRVQHKGTISNAAKAGLTLGALDVGIPGVVTGTASMGFNREFRESNAEEETKRCPVGPVPAGTKVEQIRALCKTCQGDALPTLRNDIESRMKNYAYLIQNPICESDKECELEPSLWNSLMVGRCVLTQDDNKNYISECQNRSKIGGACPGEDSEGLTEYRCDRGLVCMQTKKGKGWWTLKAYDHNEYECRDPKRPHLKRPPKGE